MAILAIDTHQDINETLHISAVNFSSKETNHLKGDKSLSFSTKVQGVLTQGVWVGLYDRENFELYEKQQSNLNGIVTFENLSPTPDLFFAVALTDQSYNGLVFDKVEAV